MKKVILLAIALMFILSYGSIVCAQDSVCHDLLNKGCVRLCAIRPYRLSLITSPNFIWLDPPTNKIASEWLQVQFTNTGTADAYNVTAKISCFPPGDSSTDQTVTIGTVSQGAFVWSVDDFQLTIDTTKAAIEKGVCWEVTYNDINGNQYVVTDIAKFCGEDCCQICDCTVIELDSFTAVAGNKNVLLTWETAAERDNIGFNIYRADSKDGEYVKINSAIIPAQGSAFQGMKYTYTDSAAKNRKTYYYKLEDIDIMGTSTVHGPYSATPRLIFGLFKW